MKSKYRIYEEKEDHYREKANDMEAMGIFYGVIGLFSMVPIMLVLTAFGISEESAKPWAYVGFVPCLICALSIPAMCTTPFIGFVRKVPYNDCEVLLVVVELPPSP